MAKKVKTELGSENLEIHTRRELATITLDSDNNHFLVRYREVKYYIDNSSGKDVEVIISTEGKSYTEDYEEFEASPTGLSLMEMVEGRFGHPDPQNPPEEA